MKRAENLQEAHFQTEEQEEPEVVAGPSEARQREEGAARAARCAV